MNKIINLLDVEIGPHRNDFACIDCKHSHWYTGCYGPTIAQNELTKKSFEEIRVKSNYTPEEFLANESEVLKKYLSDLYDKKNDDFKLTTTHEQYILNFTQSDILKIANYHIQQYKQFVQKGPSLQPENIVLICYCKVLYKETYNTTLTEMNYFHMTACEAKPGMLKEEGK